MATSKAVLRGSGSVGSVTVTAQPPEMAPKVLLWCLQSGAAMAMLAWAVRTTATLG